MAVSAETEFDKVRRLKARLAKIPMLEREEEQSYAKSWRWYGDRNAKNKLVNAHLRLALKFAFSQKGYGIPIIDLFQEAALGLEKAADRFDPDKGVRFSTYGMWWMKVVVQEYVMKNHNMIKMGTTATQKKIFFNFKRARAKVLQERQIEDLDEDGWKAVADIIGGGDGKISVDELKSMAVRMSGDFSLNSPLLKDDGNEGLEFIDTLASTNETKNPTEDDVVERDKQEWMSGTLSTLLAGLTDRERHIIEERKLAEDPATLEYLGRVYGVSKERVRQIETAALNKMKGRLEDMGCTSDMIFG